MRVLIIKTSSLGDVIHTLPALTDAGVAIPGVRFDWVVEESFAEIPRWHPLVDRVIPVAIRRWRKNLFNMSTYAEINKFLRVLRAEKYDLIIDAQGLFKSGLLARLARGVRCGMNRQSARESYSAFFYQQKYDVKKGEHAIARLRNLFSQALNYVAPGPVVHYGINRNRFIEPHSQSNYVVFLHGTTWATKHWPEEYWLQLARRIGQQGFSIKLPWGNLAEKVRAERIAASCLQAEVLPRLDLAKIAGVLAGAKAIVAVDTGLGHLAAALNVPTLSLYGPTNADLTGTMGLSQMHLSAKFSCAPCLKRECNYRAADYSPLYPGAPACFTTTTGPAEVWGALETLL